MVAGDSNRRCPSRGECNDRTLPLSHRLPIVKKRVFDACLMSAIFYGCESWLNGDLKPVNKLNNWSLKNLLDVRLTTCNDVCYVESGYPPVQPLVRSRQRSFFTKMRRERQILDDDPIGYSIRTAMENRYCTTTYVESLLRGGIDDVAEGLSQVKANICNSTSTKRSTYKEMNPSLTSHSIYMTKANVSEHHSCVHAFSSFRTLPGSGSRKMEQTGTRKIASGGKTVYVFRQKFM